MFNSEVHILELRPRKAPRNAEVDVEMRFRVRLSEENVDERIVLHDTIRRADIQFQFISIGECTDVQGGPNTAGYFGRSQ
jgi:hypothetical protein